jgi:ABC-2 type transport system permease protein
MRNCTAIARREILSFFVSPIAYFVITGFVLLSGYFFFNLIGFFNHMLLRSQAMPFLQQEGPSLNRWVIEGFYQTLVVVLVFLIPMLTMRTIAEEKKRGTFELLVTSPISVSDIVIGKYLGIAFVLFIMNTLVFGFPLLLVSLADVPVEIAPIFTGYIGILLCSLAFASLSMAVSCFTENQIVAAVTGMVTLLLFYVIHSPAQTMEPGIAQSVLNYVSPVMQLRDPIRGVLTLQGGVYFASVIVVGIFLSQRALEMYRWR